MKKTLALVLAAVMLLSLLSACKSSCLLYTSDAADD